MRSFRQELKTELHHADEAGDKFSRRMIVQDLGCAICSMCPSFMTTIRSEIDIASA